MEITKEKIVELWNKILHNEKSQKEYQSMAIGRHDKVGDGWRTITIKVDRFDYYITLERNPCTYLMYDAYKNRFDFGKDDLYEQMCIEFDTVRKALPKECETHKKLEQILNDEA